MGLLAEFLFDGDFSPSSILPGVTVGDFINVGNNVFAITSLGYTTDPVLRMVSGTVGTPVNWAKYGFCEIAGATITQVDFDAARGGGGNRGFALRHYAGATLTDIQLATVIPSPRPSWTSYSYTGLSLGDGQFRWSHFGSSLSASIEIDSIRIYGTLASSGNPTGNPAGNPAGNLNNTLRSTRHAL